MSELSLPVLDFSQLDGDADHIARFRDEITRFVDEAMAAHRREIGGPGALLAGAAPTIAAPDGVPVGR